jgi:hypothetical protein
MLAAATTLLFISAVDAHHSVTPVYDATRVVRKEGVVRSFRFVNPHAMLTLDVEESGKVVSWLVEFDGLVNLARFGWTNATLKPGDQVIITGNPTHINTARMFFIELERSDGTHLRRPLFNIGDELEQARRERAEPRQK